MLADGRRKREQPVNLTSPLYLALHNHANVFIQPKTLPPVCASFDLQHIGTCDPAIVMAKHYGYAVSRIDDVTPRRAAIRRLG
jgi:hypothetical protein